jgi:hypothetical protein
MVLWIHQNLGGVAGQNRAVGGRSGAASAVAIGAPQILVPGDASVSFPARRSNNNVDLARHADRLWLSWRTAPTHFASSEAALHVSSSGDGGATWRHDHSFTFGRDVREPRFFEHDGALFLTFFTAGTRGTRFEPDRVWISRRDATAGAWSEPVAVGPTDTVVWRVRPIGGRLVMSVYRHASTLFTAHPRTLEVELWTSTDGFEWTQMHPDGAAVHVGGSESEILELPDGRVLMVVRKEGPDGGWGCDVGICEPGDRTSFRWRSDPRKTDSPLLFVHDGQPYLICRRQVAFGGRFDLGWRWPSPAVRTRLYQLLYWLTPKRTALYAVDPDALTLTWLADLPSNGDTAFAAQVPLDDNTHLVANYSSRTDRRWWPWVLGQLRPTHIYAVELHFAAST